MKSNWPTKSKIKMQKSKLSFKKIEFKNNEWRLYILPDEYFTPERYIQNLIDQLKKDIFPLFKVKGFAPFTISRNIFCFIDHVSTLKYGIKEGIGGQTERIKILISEFAKFNLYVNSKYNIYSDYIVQIYRHDLVHNVRPLPHKIQIIDKNNNKSNGICWFFISSYIKNDALKPKKFNKLIEYFKNIKNRSGLCHLRYTGNQIVINNYCLFFDFVIFLEEYKKLLKDNVKLQEEFAKNYKEIVKKYFEIKNFILDKRKDKECNLTP